MLRTAYNAEDGLNEDVSIRLYQRAAISGGDFEKLEAELRVAFSCGDFPWQKMLCNDEYEVIDCETEDEACKNARRLLWEPLFKK